MNKTTWVKLAFYMFTLVAAVGVYLEFGLGWSLMFAGVIGAAMMLLLVDVDEKKEGKR